ncbi:MAG: NrfD/PsrC family molybdoenzyme membrane anchor subunit [Desulfitobacteriia bacterium]|jgi:polysulfide reductase chain C
MHWHWLIVIYLFLGGLGAGAYLTSFAAEKGWLGKTSSLKRVGYYIAAPVVALGTALLVFDLGQGFWKPWLLIGLLSNFSSVMTWGVYILSAFILVGLIKGFCVWKNIAVPDGLTWSGAVLALATGTYTGLLLAAVKAVPFWSTGIMPLLFVVSALSTGLSLSSLLAPLVEREYFTVGRENQVHILLIGAELIIVTVLMGMMISGINGPAGQASATMLITGVYSLVFWGYFIGLGLIVPLLAFIIEARRSKRVVTKEVAIPLAAREIAATVQRKHHSYLTIVTDVSVLVGGFALRALIILAALPVWDGLTIP